MNDERRLALAVGLDVFVVVLFVAIGRRNHDESGAFVEVVKTALPFLIGLAAAWAAVRAWRRPTALFTGISIWPLAVLTGMVARRLVFDRGTATSFVVIATVFLGVFLVGWRAVLRQIELRRSHRTSVHPC